jgi:hypothetical protein
MPCLRTEFAKKAATARTVFRSVLNETARATCGAENSISGPYKGLIPETWGFGTEDIFQ